MKPFTFFFSVSMLIWTLSCQDTSDPMMENRTETFTLQRVVPFTGYADKQVMDITWSADKAVVTRAWPTSPGVSQESNTIYVRTNALTIDQESRLIPVASDIPIWFIPFGNGTAPIELGSGNICAVLERQGARGTSPDQFPSSHFAIDTIARKIIFVPTSGLTDTAKSSCATVCVMAPCEGRDRNLYYDTYQGGVILQARTVEIIEPAGFKKSNDNTLKLILVEGEGLYIRDEYERHKATSSSDHR